MGTSTEMSCASERPEVRPVDKGSRVVNVSIDAISRYSRVKGVDVTVCDPRNDEGAFIGQFMTESPPVLHQARPIRSRNKRAFVVRAFGFTLAMASYGHDVQTLD